MLITELNGKLENLEWNGEYGFFVPLSSSAYYSNVIAFIPLPNADTKYDVRALSAEAMKDNTGNEVISKTIINTFSGGIGVYVQDNTYAGCMLVTLLSITPK